ncbi:gasdermin [Promicromonospora soli]
MSIFRRGAESFLPNRDYLPLAMPTTGVSLLDLLTKDGPVLRRYSSLSAVLTTGADPIPTSFSEERVADATGSTTRHAKVGIGLGIVGSIVQALGAGADLDLKASKAHKVQFTYTDVVADRFDIAALDKWLVSKDLDPTLRNAAELLVAERLYVVVAVLKAKGLSVTFLDESDHEIAVDVPVVQQAVGAKVSVERSSSRTGTVTFEGKKPLVIAATAAALSVDDSGFWVAERPVTRGEIRESGRDPRTSVATSWC